MIGTLMKDILKVFNHFFRSDHHNHHNHNHHHQLSIHLVELSQSLRKQQYNELVVCTHSKNSKNRQNSNDGIQNNEGNEGNDNSKVDQIDVISRSSLNTSNNNDDNNDNNNNDNNKDHNNDHNDKKDRKDDKHVFESNLTIKDSLAYESSIYPGITIHWHSFLNQVPSDAPDLIIGKILLMSC